ncbi:hypothetical protein RhiTH_010481 [Rhizoctonia solani]
MLSAELENIFGLQAPSPLVFKEQGPGIELLADLVSKYLLRNYKEKPVLAKWLEDLTTAAEEVSKGNPTSIQLKQTSKLSVVQKQTNKYLELEASKVADQK